MKLKINKLPFNDVNPDDIYYKSYINNTDNIVKKDISQQRKPNNQQPNGCGLHPKDIDFMKKNKIFSKKRINILEKQKDIYDDPNICIDHRRRQEILRDKYNYYSEQESWDKNNEFLHNYDPKN